MDPESRTKNLHLYLAILLGDVEELQNCIASGADVAVADKFGDTFLHYVAKLGHCRVASVLLEAGVDPNASNGAGQTPLHYAARAGNEKMIRILLRNGAHMRVLDQGSYTPLHIASQRQRDKAACLLYRNKTTKTKIYRPKRQNIMIDCDLFHKLDAIVATAERTTVLDFLGMKDIHTAVTDGEIDRVKKLLEKKQNVHSKSHDLSTPLHFSASGESTDIVKLLLEKGANPDAENETGDTPLHLAAISGKIEVLPLLATAANINKSSATHDKLIHYARYGGENPEQAMLDVSHLSSEGNTPLHFACLAGHIEAVNILLEKGANPECTAESGHTPLHYASLRGHTKIVQKLIEVGADVNALDRHRCTALHYAASAGHTSVVEELARSGTDLQLFTDAGKSVLHDASFYGRLDSTQRLAEIQPDLIDVRDKLALSAEDTAHIRGHAQAAWWLQKQTEAETKHETFNHRTEMMAREYTVLEQAKEEAKSSASRKEVLEVTFLFLVLCLEFDPLVNSSVYPDDRWRTVLSWVLSLHSLDTERYKDKAAWIKEMIDTFREIWREVHSYHEEDNPSCYKYHLELVGKLHSRFWNDLDEISELFCDTDNNTQQENYICELLKRATIKSCEKNMPLFLHLLSCVAGVKFSEKIDAVCGGFPLHCAALHNNMSAARYIRSKGASPRVQDRFGNTPAHYAYMFGHQEVGDFLKTDLANNNGFPAEYMLEGYNHYLKLYKLNSNDLQKRKMQRDNTASQIIQERLQNLKRNSIDQAVKECHVDFTSGEAHEIQTAVTDFIGQVTLSVGEANSLYKGNLHMLGSSGDNVRLFCPDEFDFNIIMQSMEPPFLVNWNGELRDIPENSEVFSALEDFYYILRRCLVKCKPKDRRLAIVLPGVKKTQVGVALSLVWTGEVFPLLLVDVDVVATVRASWPPALRRPKLMPSTFDSVYLNSIGNNEWRFSFALAENAVMKTLTADKRSVFLTCKLVLSALKVEKWAPRHIQNQFKYFHGRFFKIPSPKGFLLKNTFFLELEEVTDEEQWTEEHLVERMTSIFRRMCEEYTDSVSQVTSWEPAAVKAYFAGPTQSPCVGFGAPEILKFLKSLESQLKRQQNYEKQIDRLMYYIYKIYMNRKKHS